MLVAIFIAACSNEAMTLDGTGGTADSGAGAGGSAGTATAGSGGSAGAATSDSGAGADSGDSGFSCIHVVCPAHFSCVVKTNGVACVAVTDGGTPPVCQDGTTAACATSCASIGKTICLAHQWGACVPPVETCDGKDDDCDGVVDNGCTLSGVSTVVYKYQLPAGMTAKTITVFDEALDAQGDPLPRLTPFGSTDADERYVYGTATDTTNGGCFASLTGLIECTVHRPTCATIKANVDVQIADTQNSSFEACDSASGHIKGSFQVWVNGKEVKPLSTEPWWSPAQEPFCKVVFHTPCP